MHRSIFTQVWEFLKNIWAGKDASSNKNGKPLTSGNSVPYLPLHKTDSTRFNISAAADEINEINQSGGFHCRQFNKDQYGEGWVFQKRIILLGKVREVQIEVTTRYDDDLLTFLMPMYFEEGHEGLKEGESGKEEELGKGGDLEKGVRLGKFDAMIHIFNFQLNGGHFTKITDDHTNALVFMDRLSSSRTDLESFKSTLDYFVEILRGYRPFFDAAINDLGLQFDKNAGLEDPGRIYLEEKKKLFNQRINLILGSDDQSTSNKPR